ncbi:MAG: hypothetical protein AMK69_01135 [Nitrospira bacterium SG8_3]|nr:MAG: hypothetical protein AMK69_01135 [Nitrospira bacterium SG8_3]
MALISLGLLFLAALFLCAASGLFFITPADKGGKNQLVIVKEGLSLKEVAGELDRKKIITSKALFEFWAELLGYSRKIKAGEYEMGSHMAPKRILEKLIKGEVITYPVTVPEGFTVTQISQLLHEGGLIDKEKFLSLINDPALLEHYGISAPSLEGYLYPETYHFARGISARSTIDAMVDRFWQAVRPLKERTDEVGMNLPEVITLASIVEKETGLAEERPTIASVFLNRLKRGMRLESDPTVIYGIKDFDGNLTRKDLNRATPYNTYIIRGLPPGPIANPGLEAIRAVLYPAKTDYLYFVSRNDGSHHFSKTLSEHNKAVQIYQKGGRKRRGKTP